jgi:hypothetical protein
MLMVSRPLSVRALSAIVGGPANVWPVAEGHDKVLPQRRAYWRQGGKRYLL